MAAEAREPRTSIGIADIRTLAENLMSHPEAKKRFDGDYIAEVQAGATFTIEIKSGAVASVVEGAPADPDLKVMASTGALMSHANAYNGENTLLLLYDAKHVSVCCGPLSVPVNGARGLFTATPPAAGDPINIWGESGKLYAYKGTLAFDIGDRVYLVNEFGALWTYLHHSKATEEGSKKLEEALAAGKGRSEGKKEMSLAELLDLVRSTNADDANRLVGTAAGSPEAGVAALAKSLNLAGADDDQLTAVSKAAGAGVGSLVQALLKGEISEELRKALTGDTAGAGAPSLEQSGRAILAFTFTMNPGDYLLRGTADDDSIMGNALPNTIRLADGNDVADGAAGDDNIGAGNGADDVRGGLGDDTLSGGDGDDLLYGDDGDDKIFGERGNDVLRGGEGDDRMSGGSGADEVYGDAGNDRLRGGPGEDKIYGGPGDDEIFAADGSADTVDCGDGNDTVRSHDEDDVIAENCEGVR